ncbi:Bug family tripartite tricarboxylate transporter substrate binding protein [Jannaschia donghaensis]|uniref:Tripartite tricarboxylate transporter family receptor n=1 Tax=Jannaschia donghaensis TaxID=420998 RepID=A0A0M6YF57_9RHOB|nr:tripartite tricarboxylate transporter substrate binding protein [Jannaschia donghaensis]CTQ48315.1 Tripartite tricarboxylate transporter family receptor [Jannaschia donghaensis]
MKRRTLIALAAALICPFALTGTALADWAPNRPVNVILPYAAGGGTDAFARAVAAAAEAEGVLSVPMVVTNKPGAGGITGATEAAGARPDGQTIMITSAGSFLLTSELKDTPVHPLEDFEIVAQVGDLDPAILVPMDSPHATLSDLVAALQADPAALRWAHNGVGGAHNVAGQAFLDANDLQATGVPFKGGGPTRAAVIGAQVDFAVVGIQQAAGFENELRVLGLLAPERDGIASDVPTVPEQGFDYVEVSSPIVVFAPKGTDPAILADMQAAFERIAASDAFADAMRDRGNVPEYLPGDAARARLEAMRDATAGVIADLGG